MVAPHFDTQKKILRAAALARRAGCDPALAEALTEHVLRDLPPPPGAAVSGYFPIGTEIDIRPLLDALFERGHRVLLPVTARRGEPLSFRRWRPGAPMMVERFGTVAPTSDAPAGMPEWLFVPLLAFDRRGHRLGYGGGFYDRTLAALPHAVAVGCAYAAQQVDAVPVGPYDARLRAVATERGILRFD